WCKNSFQVSASQLLSFQFLLLAFQHFSFSMFQRFCSKQVGERQTKLMCHFSRTLGVETAISVSTAALVLFRCRTGMVFRPGLLGKGPSRERSKSGAEHDEM